MNRKKIIIASILSILLFFSLNINIKALSPSSEPTYKGIDVSEWQGNINWRLVKEDGIEIAYIRSSVGNYVDPYFKRNYEEAKKYGIKVGFYHYVNAKNVTEAKDEAKFFVSHIAGTTPDARLAMDFENLSSLSVSEINKIAQAFLNEVKTLSKKEVVIYSDSFNARDNFNSATARLAPLWVAEYGVTSPINNGKWNIYVGWQYSDEGRINGISGNVDLDRFTKEILLDGNETIPRPTPSTSPKTKYFYYKVLKGDTLSEIAKRFDTTVSAIAKENNITNVNRIYPGEILKITKGIDYIPTNSNNNTTYIVKKGDTLNKIARKYDVSVQSIINLNNIKNPNLIYPNERLIIRGNTHQDIIYYIVKRNDTLTKIANTYKTSISSIEKLNNIKNPNLIYPGTKLEIPVNDTIKDNSTTYIHVTKSGETLNEIAKIYNINPKTLASINKLNVNTKLKEGQLIKLK